MLYEGGTLESRSYEQKLVFIYPWLTFKVILSWWATREKGKPVVNPIKLKKNFKITEKNGLFYNMFEGLEIRKILVCATNVLAYHCKITEKYVVL